ncbi:hyalin-like [Strongylocentrotus purpuratus]|uniref:HYR domain-containing protein n=1 Tax=Strongylocentrotus purpuratus TaxID=7668 RepID=A0A7M7P8R9_STRPU|nr:hyalin-like [Strongylocentrotus purpuratus]
MDGSGRWCGMPAWLFTVALMAFTVHIAQGEDPDTTPPNVTCTDVTTRPFLPNSFLGLNAGVEYTYEDSNPDPSGVTYNVTKGPSGDLFPPGPAPVTMYAVDIFDNEATCLFYVENTLTELPVNCPDLNRTVATDMGLPTYSYTPSIEASDVTKSTSGYRYHGGAVSVDPTTAIGSKLDVGTHLDTVLISDEVLSKTCIGYIVVQDTTPPNVTCTDVTTRPFLPNSFLGLGVGISYTYEDSNPDPSGITYNVTKGPGGDLFPPGRTPVTMYAVDIFNNRATCLFYVENTLTELPVNCPDLNRTVATDMGLPTYSYTPSIEASDVTKSTSGYRYHGGAVSVDPTMAIGSKLDVGTHLDTVLISDEVLSKTCIGYIVVQDTTPPNVTCTDVTTRPFLPNSFLGLGVGISYTYEDSNPDPSGITYNVTKGPGGDLFPPGRTPVTMYAVDIFNNRATCLFYVENTLTELPVNCPDLNRTVATDMGLPTYSYTLSIEASDVTKSTSGYRYHGGAVSVDPTTAIGSKLDVGTHLDTVLISDEVLSKTCIGYIVVQDIEKPSVTCPADITESSTNVIQYSANVSDNVGASVTYSPEPGSIFNPGVTTVSVVARDQAGLNDTCSFVVQVTTKLAVSVVVPCAVVLLVVFVIGFSVYYVKKSKERRKMKVSRTDGKQSSSTKTSDV